MPSGISALVPWQARLAAKVVVSPIPYRIWQRVGLFAHGRMRDPGYARGVFEKHLGFAGLSKPGEVVLEIGPGDSVASAMFAIAGGAARTFLVDSGPFATTDPDAYGAIAAWATREGYAVPDLAGARTFKDVLDAWHATYLTAGAASLAEIPTASVDFAFSNSALQHVPRADIPVLAAELRRVLKPSGVATNTIDFRDMLGGALNHLTVPRRLWESPLIASSMAYTNRLRCSDIVSLFSDAGFDVELATQKRWDTVPTPRSALAREFSGISDDDLATFHIDMVARPR